MKTYKKCKIVMLSTNEKTPKINMIVTTDKDNLSTVNKRLINEYNSYLKKENLTLKIPYKHLYITSDNKIKEGDWWLNKDDNSLCNDNSIADLANNAPSCKKIIATTDKLPTEPYQGHFNGIDCTNYLPQPPQEFVKKYIEEYNKGNIITNVSVEYENCYVGAIYDNKGFYDKQYENIFKINLKDNTITIKKIKDSLNRKKVETLLYKHTKDMFKQKIELNKWIEENL